MHDFFAGDALINVGSPPSEYPAQNQVSLWQTNAVALRCERTIRVRRLRASAARILASVDWSGASA